MITEKTLALFASCTNRPVVLESTLNPPGEAATSKHMDAYMKRWEDAGRPYVIADPPVEVSQDVEVYADHGFGMLFILEGLSGSVYIVHDILIGERFVILDKVLYNAPQYVWWAKS